MTDLPYQLSVSPDLRRFLPEISFACDFLDRAHCLKRVDKADRVLHYGSGAPGGAVQVPNVLFPHAVKTDEDGISPDFDNLHSAEDGCLEYPLLPSEKKAETEGNPSYDAIGLIFFMLSRLEERGCQEGDRYGRYPHTASLAYRHGRMRTPLADQAALDIARCLTGERVPANRNSYSVLLTHDVDKLKGYRRPIDPLRSAVGDVVKRAQPAKAWERIQRGYMSGNPWSSINKLMALAEASSQKAQFYFIGPSNAPDDPTYSIKLPGLVRRVADAIAERGHVIGFHPGSTTALDPDEWRRQKRGLEEVLGRDVKIGRHHTLRYGADVTPDIWNDNGMELDLTLSFPDISGFRSGTCRRHSAYSLRKRRQLELDHLSTGLMEFAMFDGRYNACTSEEALLQTDELIQVCRRYGGTLAILYHTNNWVSPMREYYLEFLKRAL